MLLKLLLTMFITKYPHVCKTVFWLVLLPADDCIVVSCFVACCLSCSVLYLLYYTDCFALSLVSALFAQVYTHIHSMWNCVPAACVTSMSPDPISANDMGMCSDVLQRLVLRQVFPQHQAVAQHLISVSGKSVTYVTCAKFISRVLCGTITMNNCDTSSPSC